MKNQLNSKNVSVTVHGYLCRHAHFQQYQTLKFAIFIFFFIEIYCDFTVFYFFFGGGSIQYEGAKHKIVIVTLLIQTVSIEMS